jgi:hypothetical protein
MITQTIDAPMTLDLNPSNHAVYAGCDVRKISEDHFRLNTPLDSAVIIIARNIQDIIAGLLPEEREELVLTGSAPPAIYLTALSVAGPFFKKVIHFHGDRQIETEIPQPPPDFQNESED